jgi:hypothetical protein
MCISILFSFSLATSLFMDFSQDSSFLGSQCLISGVKQWIDLTIGTPFPNDLINMHFVLESDEIKP